MICIEPAERRAEPRLRFAVHGREAAEPPQCELAVNLAQHQIDVVGHARLLRAWGLS